MKANTATAKVEAASTLLALVPDDVAFGNGYVALPRTALNLLRGAPSDAFVLLHLLSRCDVSGRCFPSLTRLADDSGLSRRCVQDALARLKDAGLITWETGKTGRANTYTVLAGRAESATPRAESATPRATVALTPGQNLPPNDHHSTSIMNEHHERPRRRNTSSAPRKNKFDDVCLECGGFVPAGEGRLVGKKAMHVPGKCRGATPTKVRNEKSMSRSDYTL